MPAKRQRSPREVSLAWNQGLQIVTEFEPIDGFVDVIRLRVLTYRDHLVLKFDSREHVMLLLEAVLALLDAHDRQSDYLITRVFKLAR